VNLPHSDSTQRFQRRDRDFNVKVDFSLRKSADIGIAESWRNEYFCFFAEINLVYKTLMDRSGR